MIHLKHRTSGLLLIGFLICHAGTALAQDSHRFEVFGSVGTSTSAELFQPSSTSPNLGFGFGIRPFSASHGFSRGLGLELEFDTASEKQFNGGLFTPATFSGHGRQNLFLGDVLYHFGDGRVEPYVLAGVGVASNPNYGGAGGLGAGVKIFVQKHVSLRPEIRLSVTRHDDFSARVSFAVGYHW